MQLVHGFASKLPVTNVMWPCLSHRLLSLSDKVQSKCHGCRAQLPSYCCYSERIRGSGHQHQRQPHPNQLCQGKHLALLKHSPTSTGQTAIASATSGAAAGQGWTSDEPKRHQEQNSNSSSRHVPQFHSTSNNAASGYGSRAAAGAGLLQQLQDDLRALANALLSAATDALSAAVRPGLLRRLQALLSQPETRLLLEGCQLLACLMFVLLYVWR